MTRRRKESTDLERAIMRATHGRPVSVLDLSAVHAMAVRLVSEGKTEDQAADEAVGFYAYKGPKP